MDISVDTMTSLLGNSDNAMDTNSGRPDWNEVHHDLPEDEMVCQVLLTEYTVKANKHLKQPWKYEYPFAALQGCNQ